MTKEEAIVELCNLAHDPSVSEQALRAIALGAKALARAGIHKRRCHASRAARGKKQ